MRQAKRIYVGNVPTNITEVRYQGIFPFYLLFGLVLIWYLFSKVTYQSTLGEFFNRLVLELKQQKEPEGQFEPPVQVCILLLLFETLFNHCSGCPDSSWQRIRFHWFVAGLLTFMSSLLTFGRVQDKRRRFCRHFFRWCRAPGQYSAHQKTQGLPGYVMVNSFFLFFLRKTVQHWQSWLVRCQRSSCRDHFNECC